MKASLAVCVLAALLATGSCLECEVCEGPGTSCSGTLQTCAAGYDSCGIIVTETTIVGMNQNIVIKGCVTSSECKVGTFTMNFGNGVTARTGIACCLGDACKTTTVTVPPADPKPNGQRCPACIATIFAQCNEVSTQCTGSDTRCIELTGTITIGETATLMTMKGCASESVCAQIKPGARTLAGVSGDPTVTCKAPGPAPGPAGLLIPALAGLLLLKVFS
ncbi:Phospholipase A2 inhibitor subunit gamma B [Platysternon megacephalum]|uniref:Phospholipase A2 inhibitor subunit gamma B n=1 Tax=Platysternon megacephalum TaxID=55544 RepID=A0A4D9DMC4_9SAUR|nr:Phospholipase A2 inhibitor subunit gamma B [Platysternon megacephalum]